MLGFSDFLGLSETFRNPRMACPEGLEPPTCGLEGRCSIQLSYGQRVVGVTRFERATYCSQSRRATRLRYTPTEWPFYGATLSASGRSGAGSAS
jgi:hypothetical protein